MRLRESLTLLSQRTKRADADDQRIFGQRRRYPEGKHMGTVVTPSDRMGLLHISSQERNPRQLYADCFY
jgi:hypothetical protein